MFSGWKKSKEKEKENETVVEVKKPVQKIAFAQWGTSFRTQSYFLNEEGRTVFLQATKNSDDTWSLIEVEGNKNTKIMNSDVDSIVVESDSLSSHQNVSFQEAIQFFSYWEMGKNRKTLPVVETSLDLGFTHFRTFGEREGLLFDDRTGEVYLFDGSVPKEGTFLQENLDRAQNYRETAMLESAKNQAMASMDGILAGANFGGNLSTVFANVEVKTALNDYMNAFLNAKEHLEKMEPYFDLQWASETVNEYTKGQSRKYLDLAKEFFGLDKSKDHLEKHDIIDLMKQRDRGAANSIFVGNLTSLGVLGATLSPVSKTEIEEVITREAKILSDIADVGEKEIFQDLYKQLQQQQLSEDEQFDQIVAGLKNAQIRLPQPSMQKPFNTLTAWMQVVHTIFRGKAELFHLRLLEHSENVDEKVKECQKNCKKLLDGIAGVLKEEQDLHLNVAQIEEVICAPAKPRVPDFMNEVLDQYKSDTQAVKLNTYRVTDMSDEMKEMLKARVMETVQKKAIPNA